MKNESGWMGRWMAPRYRDRGEHGLPEVVYAPTLDYAFKLARTMWPTAIGWVCLGKQSETDPEVLS